MTLKGTQLLPMMTAIGPQNGFSPTLLPMASSLPLLIASRKEMLAKYNQLMDLSHANLQRPLRQVDWDQWEKQIMTIHESPVQSVHFLLVHVLIPSLESVQRTCERYLGNRDGTEVAISLKLYHRKYGKYPQSLAEMTPEMLSQIPVDRITGDLVKYRLIHGMPIVYSVGADRIDDGGNRLDGKHALDPARWDKRSDAVRGDWILYPPDPKGDE